MIRIALESDVPAMLAIYAPFVRDTTVSFEYDVPTEEEFLRRFRQITLQFPWLVWEEDGKILGYAYGSPPYSRAAYSWCAEPSIYLAKEAQRKGIGRKLYAALETILEEQGYQVLYALITAENTASIAFHEKMGYETKVEFSNCGYKFSQWLGLIWMEKRIKSPESPEGLPTPWKAIVQDVKRISNILDNLSIS